MIAAIRGSFPGDGETGGPGGTPQKLNWGAGTPIKYLSHKNIELP